MLRSFHYTDSNGKDQGINVRNRSKELVALLGDDEKIRSERKKARAAKDKFVGVASNDLGGSSGRGGFAGTGKKYGGFGSDSADFGGYSGGVYGDGGGFGGESSSRAAYSASRDSGQFEEYDVGVEDSTTTTEYASVSAEPPATKPKAPEVDLFSFDDNNDNEILAATPGITPGATPAPPASAFDDDFDDFQSAVASPATTTTTSTAASITNLFNQPPAAATPSYTQPAYAQPTYAQPQQFGQFISSPSTTSSAAPVSQPSYFAASATSGTGPNYNISGFSATPSQTSGTVGSSSSAAAKKKDDVFGSLWSTAASGVSKKPANSASSSNVSMAKLAQQSATAGIWDQARSNSTTSANANANVSSPGGDDLLL